MDSRNNDVELYYFTNANRRLDMKRNPDYSTIENDLLVESMLQNSNNLNDNIDIKICPKLSCPAELVK